MIIYFGTIVFLLFVIEILFRIYYRLKHGNKYVPPFNPKREENYVISHPFLSISYKKNSLIKLRKELNYSIQKNKYYSFEKPLRLNNCGHFGNDFVEEKIKNTIRIACLGNSTTANNISYDGKDYCYPDILQESLQSKIHLLKGYDKVEVYNYGIGGWVCQDILIDFILNVVRMKPDYIIFCHGFVDVPFHMMEDYSNDYFHGRKNLGEVIKEIQFVSYFPKLPFWKSYEYIKMKIFGTGFVRDEVIQKIRKQKVNVDNNLNYDTLKSESDILRNIFIICKHYNINMIASSYPFYNYDYTSMSKKIEEGVLMENKNIQNLAKEFNTIFIDHDNLVPKTDEYFLDWVHFTPEGMKLLAENYSELVIMDVSDGA